MEWTRWIISVPKDIRWSRRCTSWGITSLKYRRSLQLILFERHNATPVTVYNNCTDVSIKLKLSFPTLFDVPTSFYGGIAGILSTILYTLKSDSNSIRFWCVSRFEEKKKINEACYCITGLCHFPVSNQLWSATQRKIWRKTSF